MNKSEISQGEISNNLNNFDTYFIDQDKKLYSIVPLGKPERENREQYKAAYYTSEGLVLDKPLGYKERKIADLEALRKRIIKEIEPLVDSGTEDDLSKVENILEELNIVTNYGNAYNIRYSPDPGSIKKNS